LLLGLVAGALVDRWDRLRIMATTDLARAALFGAFAFAVATGRSSLALIVAVAFVAGLAGILNQNASLAFVPTVVDRERLETANSWLQAGLTVPSSLLGPPLGGLLFVAAASLPFTVDALSFAASGVLVLTLRGSVRQQPRTSAHPPLRAALVEGMRFLWHSQVLRVLCLLLAVVNGSAAAVVGIAVLFVRQTLGLPERGFGLLLTVFAVGGLAGTVLAPWARRRIGTSGIVALVLGTQSAAMLLTGLVPTLPQRWWVSCSPAPPAACGTSRPSACASGSCRTRFSAGSPAPTGSSGSARCRWARPSEAWWHGPSGYPRPSWSPGPPQGWGCSPRCAGCRGRSWSRPRRPRRRRSADRARDRRSASGRSSRRPTVRRESDARAFTVT
jgi:Na+/melibiose symporter-like transporter